MKTTKLKVLNDFSDCQDDEISSKAKYILSSMTHNGHYFRPIPHLSSLSDAVQAFEKALDSTSQKDKTEIKIQKRNELLNMLNWLGLYVQKHCKDNLSILRSSGFEAKEILELV